MKIQLTEKGKTAYIDDKHLIKMFNLTGSSMYDALYQKVTGCDTVVYKGDNYSPEQYTYKLLTKGEQLNEEQYTETNSKLQELFNNYK